MTSTWAFKSVTVPCNSSIVSGTGFCASSLMKTELALVVFACTQAGKQVRHSPGSCVLCSTAMPHARKPLPASAWLRQSAPGSEPLTATYAAVNPLSAEEQAYMQP